MSDKILLAVCLILLTLMTVFCYEVINFAASDSQELKTYLEEKGYDLKE